MHKFRNTTTINSNTNFKTHIQTSYRFIQLEANFIFDRGGGGALLDALGPP